MRNGHMLNDFECTKFNLGNTQETEVVNVADVHQDLSLQPKVANVHERELQT